MTLYVIYDTVKDECMPPIPCKTDGQAWREYDNLIARDEYAKLHQDEYRLWSIAEWNPDTGEIEDWWEPKPVQRTIKQEIHEGAPT